MSDQKREGSDPIGPRQKSKGGASETSGEPTAQETGAPSGDFEARADAKRSEETPKGWSFLDSSSTPESGPSHGPITGVDFSNWQNQPPEPVPKKGNFLFTVGMPGRGKSTFQRHLMWYLIYGPGDGKNPEHHLAPLSNDEKRMEKFEAAIVDWQQQYQTERFPARNTALSVTEFRFRATPLNFRHTEPLDFGFFEVSGELFANMVRERAKGRAMSLGADDRLDQFLREPSNKITVILLANGEDVDKDDILFDSFLQYLDHFKDSNIYERVAIALVISYPEAANFRIFRELARRNTEDFERLSREQQIQKMNSMRVEYLRRFEGNLEKEVTRLFIATFFGATWGRMMHWNRGANRRDRAKAFTFSVGRVDGEDPKSRRITRRDFSDARAFYMWLYYQFKFKYLEKEKSETWASRSLDWIKEWFYENEGPRS